MSWVPLTTLVCNTHVGQCIGREWAGQVLDLRPAVLLPQEVVPEKFGLLVSLLGDEYRIAPGLLHRRGRESTQTPVLLRRDRFKIRSQSNKQVSPWRGGGEHGRLWPTRFATQVRAFDSWSERWLHARSVHTWVAGPKAPDAVKAEHRKQVRDVGQWAHARPAGRIVLAGGDWNENFNAPGRQPCEVTLARHGLVRAGAVGPSSVTRTSAHGPAWLDDVFFRRAGFVHVTGQRTIRNAGSGADHLMVWTAFEVEQREAKADQSS